MRESVLVKRGNKRRKILEAVREPHSVRKV